MAEAKLQHVADRVGGHTEKAGVAKRNQAGVSHQHIQPEREDGVEQDLAGDIDVIDAGHPVRQSCERCEGDGNSERARAHGTCLPNRPCGRKSRTSSIGKKRTKYASSGRSAWPKL